VHKANTNVPARHTIPSIWRHTVAILHLLGISAVSVGLFMMPQ